MTDMLARMATKRRRKGRSGTRQRRTAGRHVPGCVLLIAVAVAVVALPAWRLWWRWGESSPLLQGLTGLETEGCMGCHRDVDGAWRWRADGRDPESLASISDAIRSGRPAMPSGMVRSGSALERRLVLAVGATSGLVGVPAEPELAVGFEIARDAGCFSCHGTLGVGGVRAAGTLAGEVPGWYGRTFGNGDSETTTIRNAVADGARQPALPWSRSRGARLAMPPYRGVLDSTEIERVVRYVEWLRHEGLGTAER